MFRSAAVAVTERLMGTIDDKVSKVCLDEIIVICVCVIVLLFPLFNLPAILAFDESRRNPLTY